MDRISISNLDFVGLEPRGKAILDKFWVNDHGALKLVKPSGSTNQDQMEYISSYILKQIGLDCVEVSLGYDETRKPVCLVTNFLKEGEVSYDILEWKYIRTKNMDDELELCFYQVFKKYSDLYGMTKEQLENLKKQYIRLIFGKCILENCDTKLENIGLIFNEKTKEYRLPPSYDNGCAFRSYASLAAPTCCIGNQMFEISQVMEYILTYYLDYVEDIIGPFHSFVTTKLDSITSLLTPPTTQEQIAYIHQYLKNIDIFIQNHVKNKRK